MIDSEFIIKYTNALYATDKDSQPRYDEFRDMFSSGQIKSKVWAVETLCNLNIKFSSAVILGCWFGTLGMMLKKKFPGIGLTLLDINPVCNQFNRHVFYKIDNINFVTGDMFSYTANEDLIVNTSCEHIDNFSVWIKSLPENKLVLLQSNNYSKIPDHINCSSSLDDFRSSAELKQIYYAGQIEMPMYTRYMIIGLT